jgi:hypothetical protein
MIASCHQETGSHLSVKKMSKILLDIQIAESYSTLVGRDSTHKNNEKNLDSLAVYYKEILAHHKVSQQEFSESLDWYRSHPDVLDSVYEKIIPEITKMQVQAEKK